MQLTVKSLSGSTNKFQVEEEDKILYIKKLIQEKIGIRIEQQRLVLNGKILSDDKSIKESNVNVNTVLQLILQLKGGGSLNLTKEQVDEIIDWVSENGFDGVSNEERNILIDNTHFIVTDCQGGVLSGVYQRSGFTAAKTNKVIIIGYYDNNSGIQKGPNHDQVQYMAEILKKKGY
ncbi:hypothetical protein ABK040_003820 [Willaertia magna]